MSPAAKVLVVGKDENLVHTQELILGCYFYVKGAVRLSEAAALAASIDFDLIVLCPTLSDEECRFLAGIAHSKETSTKILAMHRTALHPSKPWATREIGQEAGPYGLVKLCAEMLGYKLRSKARHASRA